MQSNLIDVRNINVLYKSPLRISLPILNPINNSSFLVSMSIKGQTNERTQKHNLLRQARKYCWFTGQDN